MVRRLVRFLLLARTTLPISVLMAQPYPTKPIRVRDFAPIDRYVPHKGATAFGLEIHTEPPEFFTATIRKNFATWDRLAHDIGFKPR